MVLQSQDGQTAGASIWLMPSEADAVMLRGIITDLARRFGTPDFEPHLTLAGDLRAAPAAYLPVLADLAKATPAFSQPIVDIVLTDAYFRSFYAAFDQSSELQMLKSLCVAAVGGTGQGFMPHVSLLYGSIPQSEKNDAAQPLRFELRARSIVFDRVVVTNSSDNVPVHEWRVHAARRLRGPRSADGSA